jgi:adenine-specific DNA-methyltransferase
VLVQRSPGPDPKACYDNKNLIFTPSSVGFIPWHSLAGARNRSIKKSARYRDEKPPRPELPRREELEKTSRRFSVKFLIAVMNSATAHNFLRANRRSNIHLYPNDWKQLPIPDVTSKQQVPIVKLVDEILTAKRNDLTVALTPMEAQIDARVAHLYDLTEEEYSLVLSELELPDPFRVAALNFYRDIARGVLQ